MKNDSEWITGNVKLSIKGVPVELQMTVPVKPLKPQRMLPIFQQMSNSFVELGVQDAENLGGKISCKAGCGACCRQPVPLAEIEAYHLADYVETLEEPRRSEIKARFEKAATHFASIGWFDRLSGCAGKTKQDLEAVVLEYFREGISCPFLIDESCSIHPVRPLACREYLVTSPSENCASPSAEGVRMVPLPVKPSQTVLGIGQVKPLSGINFIPMVLALKWAESNTEHFPEKTGEQWMADFFQSLTKSLIPNRNVDSPN